MDKTLAEFIAYLKDNSGFERLLSAMKEKYQSYGTVKGTLIISNPTEWERQALGGLMQRDFRNAAQIRISTVLLKKSLKNTPYSALNPDDIVKAYFSSDIKSNKDIRKEKRQEEEDFFAGILNANQGTLSGKWLANILNDRGPGWDHIHRNYLADPIRLKEALINALNAGNNLPSPGSHVRLAFFSAGITGDPHTFDVGTM